MRILIADDHSVVRLGIRNIIEREMEVEVVGEAENGQQAFDLACRSNPDVIIMDISMPQLNGIEATRLIMKERPQTRIVMLSMHSSPNLVTDALKAGCKGFVLKASLMEEIVTAVWAASQDQHFLSPKISTIIVDQVIGRDRYGDSQDTLPGLTPRERQILQMVAEGKTTKKIAYELHISPKTVDATRLKVMEKTDIHNIAELTKYAIKTGLTSVEF